MMEGLGGSGSEDSVVDCVGCLGGKVGVLVSIFCIIDVDILPT